MFKKKVLILLLIVCMLLPCLPVHGETAGSSFTANQLLCAEKPFDAMPNTLEAWVYFPADTDPSHRGGAILSNYHELSRGSFCFEIYTNGNPRIYYVDRNGRKTSAVFHTVNVYNGQWTHIALVRDESRNTITCYANGVAKESATVVAESLPPLGVPYIGGDSRKNNTESFKGKLRSVVAYADMRSPQEIQEDMVSPGNRKILAHWDLSTPEESYADLSGNGYNVAATPLGKSFRADEIYTLSNKLDTLPKTFEAWVKFPANAGNTRGGVILGNYGASYRNVLSFEIHQGGNPRLYCTDGSGVNSNLIFSSVNVYTGDWVHIAIVRDTDAKKAHCYINGSLAESLDMNMTEYVPSSELILGGDARSHNTQYFKGQLRSVSIYSHVRTSEEIATDMSTIRNDEPLAVWDLRSNAYSYMNLSGKNYAVNRNPVGMSFNANVTYETAKAVANIPGTVEGWIHFPSTMDPSQRGGVIFGNYPNSNKNVFNVEITTKGVPRLYCIDSNGTVTNVPFSSVNVYTGQWLHLAIVTNFAEKEAHCYINGVLKQTVSLAVENFPLSGSMIVGGDYRDRNAQYFKGQIESLAVYKDIRTAAEIAEDMNQLGQGDPLAYWIPEHNAYSIPDLSGNGYTLNGNFYWMDSKEPATGYDYTFAVVGDTQKVTYYDYQNGTKNLNKIYDWILSQKDQQNIQYVMGLGDITEKGNIDAEWDLALEAIGRLDGQIPYSLVRGNHDNSKKMNQYFKDLSKTPYSTTYSGSYDGNVNNTWRTITAGSMKVPYLILTLDFGITDQIITWASEIIEAHPHHNVIITTHAYLFRDGTTLDSGDSAPPTNANPAYNNGDQLWEKFVRKHKNIVFVLSGHDPSSQIVYRQDPGDHGNIITQMLIDPQGVDQSTLTGAVALFHFSADGRQVEVEYYATIQEKYFMSSNQFTMTVDGVVHTEVVDAAVAPTCTATGLTEGRHCSVCNAVLIVQEVVPATGHSYTYKATKNPTTSATGTLTGTCSKCSGTTTVTLPKLNTTDYTKTVTKAATCTVPGLDTYRWNTSTYGSYSFTAKTETLGHTVVNGLCSTCGKKYAGTLLHFAAGSPELDFAWNILRQCSKPTFDTTGTGFAKGTISSPGGGASTDIYLGMQAANNPDNLKHTLLTKDEIFQIRFKLDLNIPIPDNSRTKFYLKTNDVAEEGVYSETYRVYTDKETKDAQGFSIATMTIPDTLVGKVIETLRVDFLDRIGSVEMEGSYTIDYIYMGPGCTAPNPVHTYSYAATTTPTLTATGTLTGTCKFCGYKITLTLPKLNTTDYTKTVTKAATCTASGTDTYKWKTTTYGTFSFTATTKAKGHTEVVDTAVAPTCTTTGLTEGKHCSVCDKVLTAQEVVPATGHTSIYTPRDEEIHIITCENCDLIEEANHNYTDGLCICGERESKEPVEDPKLRLSHSLNLADDISINFAVSKTALAGFDLSTVYVESIMETNTGEGKTETTTIRLEPVDRGNYYYFTLTGLTAVEMKDRITSTLYGTKDGQPYISPVDDYSIADYAYSQLNNPVASQSLKTLCADLLRYGTKAQIFKGYGTDNLADAEMTEEQMAYLSDIDAVVFGNTNTVLNDLENAPIIWAGKSLSLDSKVSLKFVFDTKAYSGQIDGLTLRVSYEDMTGASNTITLTSPELYNASRGYYAFTLDALHAAELRTAVSVQVFAGQTPVSCTLQYSADTYGNNKTGPLLDLCKALFAYSDSAKTYFRS